jgi:hypothetical protein
MTVYDAFTPASAALAAAIPRPGITAAIAAAIAMPGRQLFLYGRTGSGKSTALFAELARPDAPRHTVVRCTPETTVDSLRQMAADRLKLPAATDPSIAVDLAATRLGELGMTLVIEDAHRLPPAERDQLLMTMKVFSDLGQRFRDLTLVVVAAVERPQDFALFGLELHSRIAQVGVPSMSVAELELLVRRGGDVLGVDMTEVAPRIARASGGSASIAHQFALTTLTTSGLLVHTSERAIVPAGAFETAVTQMLAMIPRETQSRIEAAIGSSRTRRATVALMSALSDADPDGTTIENLIGAVDTENNSAYLPEVVDALCEVPHGAVFERIGNGTVRFAEPIMHSYWVLRRPVADRTPQLVPPQPQPAHETPAS